MKPISLLLLLLGILCLSSAQELQKLVDYTNKYNSFIADVYKEIVKSKSANFLACPSSVNIVLSLFTTAAKGQTLEQLSGALRLPKKFQDIHDIFKPLTPHLQDNAEFYKLINANKIYASNDLQISDQFRTVATKVYNVDIESVNLEDTEETAKEINKWIEEKTLNTISKIVEPNDLSNTTHTVLASTAIFAGRWEFPFTRALTRRSCFYVSKRRCIVTETMRKQFHPLYSIIKYYESPEFDARLLEIPFAFGFKENQLSMLIVLPNRVDGLPALEARLGEILALPKQKFGSNFVVEVTLPKFKIETTTEMKQVVEALGVKKAFEKGANFRGLGYYKNYTVIDKIMQRVSIEVDEDGSFAAAAGLEYAGGFLGYPIKPPLVDFFVDRPFLFSIRLNRLNRTKVDYNLFVGRYVTPLY